MPLVLAPIGQEVRIVKIIADEKTKKHLANLGLLVSATLKNSESAILPVLIIIIFQVVFCDCLFTLEGGAGWLRYITPSAWGIAVFGNAAGLNDWAPPIFHKDLFALNPLIGLGVMAAITLLFVFLTTLRLKRAYRQKD